VNDDASRLGSGHLLTVLRESVFAAVSDAVLLDLGRTVTEVRLLAGHMLYDPEVSILAAGLIRAFISNPTGRQLTVAYIRPGQTLALAHLAGRRYPTAFQAIDDSNLLVIGNDRAADLQRAHPELGWAAAREFSLRLDELETELARVAFGSLRQRLAAHLLALTSDHRDAGYPVRLTRLAAAVASSREVVHRNLRPFVDDGSVSVGPDGVTVTDRTLLRNHANID
jgi:CRP/FNR family transcriptional regulator